MVTAFGGRTLRRLHQLEKENRQLIQLVADLSLDHMLLTKVDRY